MKREDFIEKIQEEKTETEILHQDFMNLVKKRKKELETKRKNIDHPDHYTKHQSGVECIEIAQHFNFNKGSALKYIWRAGSKGDEIEDLRKAIKYLNFEIERINKFEKR
jgi:hypothetical protein